MPKRRTSVTRQIRIIRNALSSVIGALDRLTPALAAAAGGIGAARPRRRKPLSPARMAALKEQGRYMGYLRGLKPRQKVQAKAMRVEKGIRAAIAFARKLAS